MRGYKLTNMHLERLLAQFKQTSDEKHPNVERVLASGYMQQVATAHVLAGGTHPASTAVDDLIEEGAPLRAAVTRPKLPYQCRAHVVYMNERRKRHKEELRRLGQSTTISRDVHDMLMFQWASDFKHLSPLEAASYHDEAEAMRLVKESKEEKTIVVPDVPGLWGLNCEKEPVRYETLRSEFLKVAGAEAGADYGREDELLPAFTPLAPDLRKSFVRDQIERDEGCAIPASERLLPRKTCREVHLGICKKACGLEYAKIFRLSKGIHANTVPHAFYVIYAFADTILLDSMTVYCCHRRPAGPQISVFIPCTLSNDNLTLQSIFL